MAAHLPFEELTNSFIRAFDDPEGKHEKQALALIRACRKLLVDYRKLKDLQALFQLIDKAQAVLDSWLVPGGKPPCADPKEKDERSPRVISFADYDRLYSERSEAVAQWDILDREFASAREFDRSRGAKFPLLRNVRKKSGEWPFGPTKSVEMSLVFPGEPHGKTSTTLVNQTLTLHEDSNLEEVVFFLFRSKNTKQRITLRHNPQFYTYSLMKALKSDQPLGALRPIVKASRESKQTYAVLLDRPIHLVFELHQPRVFGNIWKVNGGSKVAFKEFDGMLEDGERVWESMPINEFYAHSENTTRLNWRYTVDKALNEMEEAEERAPHTSMTVYKILAAVSEPSSPTLSARSSKYAEDAETLTSLAEYKSALSEFACPSAAVELYIKAS
ncbi:hypothetical protein NM688_g6321 [Phlebia brevispora]|uniref:Uncharacterized protein n=1 Tax=Phlebia brevispora TaxID=194682 RepID=A0ACC1SH59_9APHY|nr:hypothetical protein NM688_g6321 [Phlebia brevispora]